MKVGRITLIILTVLFCVSIYPCYSQEPQPVVPPPVGEIKSVDVDKDGDYDVRYYREGKYVSRVEADTNNDNTPDVVVNIKDGEFESAEADTDYDGTPDKKFTNKDEFNKWLNAERPAYQEHLNRPDWSFVYLDF